MILLNYYQVYPVVKVNLQKVRKLAKMLKLIADVDFNGVRMLCEGLDLFEDLQHCGKSVLVFK